MKATQPMTGGLLVATEVKEFAALVAQRILAEAANPPSVEKVFSEGDFKETFALGSLRWSDIKGEFQSIVCAAVDGTLSKRRLFLNLDTGVNDKREVEVRYSLVADWHDE